MKWEKPELIELGLEMEHCLCCSPGASGNGHKHGHGHNRDSDYPPYEENGGS